MLLYKLVMSQVIALWGRCAGRPQAQGKQKPLLIAAY